MSSLFFSMTITNQVTSIYRSSAIGSAIPAPTNLSGDLSGGEHLNCSAAAQVVSVPARTVASRTVVFVMLSFRLSPNVLAHWQSSAGAPVAIFARDVTGAKWPVQRFVMPLIQLRHPIPEKAILPDGISKPSPILFLFPRPSGRDRFRLPKSSTVGFHKAPPTHSG